MSKWPLYASNKVKNGLVIKEVGFDKIVRCAAAFGWDYTIISQMMVDLLDREHEKQAGLEIRFEAKNE